MLGTVVGGKCFLSQRFIPHSAPGYARAKSLLQLKYHGDVMLHKGVTFSAWHRGRYFASSEICVLGLW